MGPIKTAFDEGAICPMPDASGDGIEAHGGVSIEDGRSQTASTPELPTVLYVDLPGGPSHGDTVSRTDAALISGNGGRQNLILPRS